ncbi:uncharacterized protein LOC126902230 [Daktulosphaira vitifoliae]|uniref:uncharacterized protein LOC126902230 n=1 Tax=Daktulosphaira vitifoliae TaxID=58002 RepID=UPI0021AA76BA|nr:uncharacterized protein LOC126902230 [Daktulosphaira vitifoliae]
MMKKYTTLWLLLVLFFETSYALKCFNRLEKDSEKHLEDCSVATVNSFIATLNKYGDHKSIPFSKASSDSFTCSKIVLTGRNEDVVYHGCGYVKSDPCKSMQKFFEGTEVIKFCQTCEGDGCNSARTTHSSIVVLILTTAATYLFFGLR